MVFRDTCTGSTHHHWHAHPPLSMPERSHACQQAFLVSECIMSDLSWWAIIEKYARNNPDYFPPDTEMTALQTEFRRFFLLKVIADDKNACQLSPPLTVELAWQALLLFPKIYLTFCEQLLGARGEVIDHDNGDKELQRYRYSDTLRLYEHVFGSTPPPHLWPPVVLPAPLIASTPLPTFRGSF